MRKVRLSPHKWGVFAARYRRVSFFRDGAEWVCVRRSKTQLSANQMKRPGEEVRRLTPRERDQR